MFALSNIVIQSAINSLGTVVMAASSAAFNIEVITYDILNSFSQACTTFVGQNFGAVNSGAVRERCFFALQKESLFWLLLLLRFYSLESPCWRFSAAIRRSWQPAISG